MDLDSIKQFFINHIEKIILGVVGVLACALLFFGVSKPSYLAKRKPEELTQKANQVKVRIDEDHTKRIFEDENRQHNTGVMVRTAKLFRPIDAPVYTPSKTWAGETDGGSVVRRRDPVLVPIKSLRTMGVSCVVAFNGGKSPDSYPLADLDDADAVEKKAKKKPKKKKKKRRSPMMGMDAMMEMEDMMGMGGGPPQTMAPSGVTRKLDSKYNLGHRASAEKSKHPVPRISWFIAGTALLPYKETYEAFEFAFENADSYKATRDVPIYYDMEVQRADITEKKVDELTEQDWLSVYKRFDYVKLAAKYWNGFAPELVPKDYRDESLTMWIPPVLLDDYSQFSLHPEIPLVSRADLKRKQSRDRNNEEVEAVDLDNIDLGDDTVLAGPGARRGGGRDDFMGDDSDMMTAMMGGGGGGMRMFGARGKVDADPVQYKLVRFYDFRAMRKGLKPGRTYVYRLRYAVLDPNYPALPRDQPKLSSLTPDVIQRVSKKMAETHESNNRDYLFWSDWSEPSPPCKLPPLTGLYAGTLQAGSFNKVQLRGKQVLLPRESPSANVVLTDLDPDYNARISMEAKQVKEGAVLVTPKASTDIIDPISLKIKKLPEYQIVTGTSVIDIGGGRPLSINAKLQSPTTMLLYDSNGDLIVTDDIRDQFNYRIYSFADEKGE